MTPTRRTFIATSTAALAAAFGRAGLFAQGPPAPVTPVFTEIRRNVGFWTAFLQQVARELPGNTIYIFGHAGPKHEVTGSRADLQHHASYLGALLDYVRAEVKAGKTREQIVASTDIIKGFEDYGPLVPRPLGPAFDEVTAANP